MLPDGSDLVAEEMNDWMDLNGMEFYIHYNYNQKFPLWNFFLQICIFTNPQVCGKVAAEQLMLTWMQKFVTINLKFNFFLVLIWTTINFIFQINIIILILLKPELKDLCKSSYMGLENSASLTQVEIL